MIQFTINFLAVIGFCAFIFFIKESVKFFSSCFKYDDLKPENEDELNINAKGSYTLGTGLKVKLEDNQRDKRVFSEKFPSKSQIQEDIEVTERILKSKVTEPYGYLNDAIKSDKALRVDRFPTNNLPRFKNPPPPPERQKTTI